MLPGQLQQGCIHGVVNKIEDVFCLEARGKISFGQNLCTLLARHADAGGVDDDIPCGFCNGFAFDDLRARLLGQLRTGFRGPVQNGDVRSLVSQAKHCRTRRPAGTRTRIFAPAGEMRRVMGTTMPATSVLNP